MFASSQVFFTSACAGIRQPLKTVMHVRLLPSAAYTVPTRCVLQEDVQQCRVLPQLDACRRLVGNLLWNSQCVLSRCRLDVPSDATATSHLLHPKPANGRLIGQALVSTKCVVATDKMSFGLAEMGDTPDDIARERRGGRASRHTSNCAIASSPCRASRAHR
jgi:hypothetical protein